MIKFGEITSEVQKVNTENTDAYKEIKPQEEMSKEAADNYWEDFFNDEIDDTEAADELLYDVFDRYEDEFDFNLDIDDDIVELLQNIKDTEWIYLDEDEKMEMIDTLSDKIGEMLELKEQPEVVYYDADENDCGAYNQATNSIELNSSLLTSPEDLIETIAHELRHAYQYQKSRDPETRLDLLYRVNFENYISPISLGDGKYLFFTDYQDQLVEVEARAFAKQFSGVEVAV
jgi:hypothetical protein